MNKCYIQYLEIRNGELIEPCGDRAVVFLDGRNSINTMSNDAVAFNGHHRPYYSAYEIRKGNFYNYTVLAKGVFL